MPCAYTFDLEAPPKAPRYTPLTELPAPKAARSRAGSREECKSEKRKREVPLPLVRDMIARVAAALASISGAVDTLRHTLETMWPMVAQAVT
jgi:hypothetical protein